MRTILRAMATLTNDTSGRDGLFTPDTTPMTATFDNMTREESGKFFDIEPGDSFTLPLGQVSDPRGLSILGEGNADFDLVIDGRAAMEFRRSATAAIENVPVLMPMQGFTVVTITNPADATANLSGRYVIWGNPTS